MNDFVVLTKTQRCENIYNNNIIRPIYTIKISNFTDSATYHKQYDQ